MGRDQGSVGGAQGSESIRFPPPRSGVGTHLRLMPDTYLLISVFCFSDLCCEDLAVSYSPAS